MCLAGFRMIMDQWLLCVFPPPTVEWECLPQWVASVSPWYFVWKRILVYKSWIKKNYIQRALSLQRRCTSQDTVFWACCCIWIEAGRVYFVCETNEKGYSQKVDYSCFSTKIITNNYLIPVHMTQFPIIGSLFPYHLNIWWSYDLFWSTEWCSGTPKHSP